MINNFKPDSRTKIIWTLAWPVMVSQLLQTFLQIVDMYFISKIAINEMIAAIGFGTSIFGVIIVLSQLVATGAIALISRKTGEQDEEGILAISEQSLILALFVGTIISFVCYIFAVDILIIAGAKGIVLEYSVQYLRIVIIGVPFIFFNLTGRSILQARGDTITPMIIFGVMNVVNIIFDPIFIFGTGFFPEMGFKGAALATTLSNIIGFILMVYLIGQKIFDGKLRIVLNNFKIHFSTIFRIIKIGQYSALQGITRPLTGVLMFKIASYTGINAVAAFTIGGRMFNLVFIFLAGLTTAVSVLTGQNLGKKDVAEAEGVIRDGIKLAAINMLIFAIPYFVFSKYIMLIFTKDPEVVSMGANYLRIVYVGVIFVIYNVVYGGAFIGAGDTKPLMIASISANWGFKIPFAYLFAKILGWGANWVWLAISLSVIVESLIIIMWFRKGQWKHKEI